MFISQYTLRVISCDELREHLTMRGISTEIYYPVPQHRQKCFDYLKYRQGGCPLAESSASSVLSVPVYLKQLDPEVTTDKCRKRLTALQLITAVTGFTLLRLPA